MGLDLQGELVVGPQDVLLGLVAQGLALQEMEPAWQGHLELDEEHFLLVVSEYHLQTFPHHLHLRQLLSLLRLQAHYDH